MTKSGEGLVKVLVNSEHISDEEEELTCVITDKNNNEKREVQ